MLSSLSGFSAVSRLHPKKNLCPSTSRPSDAPHLEEDVTAVLLIASRLLKVRCDRGTFVQKGSDFGQALLQETLFKKKRKFFKKNARFSKKNTGFSKKTPGFQKKTPGLKKKKCQKNRSPEDDLKSSCSSSTLVKDAPPRGFKGVLFGGF